MNNEKTGTLIRTSRTELGMTQKQLADRIGVSNAAVSKWENGHGFPDISLLEPLAAELNLTVTELVNGERDTEAAAEDIVKDIIALSQQQRKGHTKTQAALLTIYVTAVIVAGFWLIVHIAPLRFAAVLTNTTGIILLNLAAIALGLTAWGCACMGIFGGQHMESGGWKNYTIASFAFCSISLWLPLLIMTAHARMEHIATILDTMGGYHFGAMFLLFVTLVLNVVSWIVNRKR